MEDCDQALALDKNYLKALNRRATALEALDRLEDALRGEHIILDERLYCRPHSLYLDYTAAAILDKFQNMAAAEAVERVLKKLSTNKAQQIFAVSRAISVKKQFS